MMEIRKSAQPNFPSDQSRRNFLADRLRPIDQLQPVLKSLHLAKGWLGRGTLSVLYGPSNVGKSFLAIDLGFKVAVGGHWHGAALADRGRFPGPVVYLACEGGTGFLNRIAALRIERPDEMAKVEKAGDFMLLAEALDLCTGEDADHLADVLSKLPKSPVLIIIDTLARVFGSGDENAARDMGMLVANLDRLRVATGAHVMIIHHSGKDLAQGARGSGSLRAAVDTEIEVTRSGPVITAVAKKQRDMESGASFSYQLRSVILGQDEENEDVTSAVVVPTEAPSKQPPHLKGQALIAMQALDDALKDHGVSKTGEDFPHNRKCVSLHRWRAACDRNSLSPGEGESSKRSAFHKQKTALHDRELIRIVDDFVWKCNE